MMTRLDNKPKEIFLGTLGRGRTIPAGKNKIRSWDITEDSIFSLYISPSDIIKVKYLSMKAIRYLK